MESPFLGSLSYVDVQNTQIIVNRNLLLKLLKAEKSKSLVSMVDLSYCSISWQETGLRAEGSHFAPLQWHGSSFLKGP